MTRYDATSSSMPRARLVVRSRRNNWGIALDVSFLATARCGRYADGGLTVFTVDVLGRVLAFNAAISALLQSVGKLPVGGGVISYQVARTQKFAAAAGTYTYDFATPKSAPTIVVFGLRGKTLGLIPARGKSGAPTIGPSIQVQHDRP